jgi:hypothetical protein
MAAAAEVPSTSIQPLSSEHVDSAIRLLAESYTSKNALARALGLTPPNMMDWATGAVKRSIQGGLSFVLCNDETKEVVSFAGGHFPPPSLPPAAAFEQAVGALSPANAAIMRVVRAVTELAHEHILAAAPSVFGAGVPYTTVYSGPGATSPSLFGQRAVRALSELHYERTFAVTAHSHLVLWFFCADPAPATLMRRYEAYTSASGRGAAVGAMLEDRRRGGAPPLFAAESSEAAAGAAAPTPPPADWTQPPGVPASAARAAPLQGWLQGRLGEPCGLQYVLKRIAFTFAGDFGHLHPGLAAAGDAPIEATVALIRRRQGPPPLPAPGSSDTIRAAPRL